jgi:hypothetical protein
MHLKEMKKKNKLKGSVLRDVTQSISADINRRIGVLVPDNMALYP